MRGSVILWLAGAALCAANPLFASPARIPQYHVYEIVFHGPAMAVRDNPARDVELVTVWKHAEGGSPVTVYGFWDGDGRGGAGGSVYKVRFCPTREGLWTLTEAKSNRAELAGQNERHAVLCTPSKHPGFWLADPQTQNRWYRRSDGSHPYIFGNTLYTFLSEHKNDGPSGGNIRDDVVNTSRYFKKIRFGITGGRYPNPEAKPFLDDAGKPTDNGNYSHRPNPAWFHNRVDLAVQTAFDQDMIADMILCGPDTYENRSNLQADKNGGDPTPLLRYMAARYGSYSNVWFCLCNEFDIKEPSYTTAEIVGFGTVLRQFLPYSTPVSVHAKPRDWYEELNAGRWHDHVIVQKKLKELTPAADWIARNYRLGGSVPVMNDELAYEGKGDGWTEADVIAAHVGAFLGGGYGTTGHKPANKQGHYFWGNFKAEEHLSADNLQWLRDQIDEDIPFWKMAPAQPAGRDGCSTSIFSNVGADFRVLEWPGHSYVLGTCRAREGVLATLPTGNWNVTLFDPFSKKRTCLRENISGSFAFDSGSRRALLYHFHRTGSDK